MRAMDALKYGVRNWEKTLVPFPIWGWSLSNRVYLQFCDCHRRFGTKSYYVFAVAVLSPDKFPQYRKSQKLCGFDNSHPTENDANTFTPKSDQVQISPVASPVILHHTVWRTWLFIAYSDWKMILVPVLTTSLIHFSWKGWENVLFELGIERAKLPTSNTDNNNYSSLWWNIIHLLYTGNITTVCMDFRCLKVSTTAFQLIELL